MIETDPIELAARRAARAALRGRPRGAARRRAALIERRRLKDEARDERRRLESLERDGLIPCPRCGAVGEAMCETTSGRAVADHVGRQR